MYFIYTSYHIFFIIVCDVPPEYCYADKKDFTECVEWLKSTHPDLYEEIYNKEECKEWLLKSHAMMFAKIFPDDGTEGAKEEEKKG